jgi:hypothetical protein
MSSDKVAAVLKTRYEMIRRGAPKSVMPDLLKEWGATCHEFADELEKEGLSLRDEFLLKCGFKPVMEVPK